MSTSERATDVVIVVSRARVERAPPKSASARLVVAARRGRRATTRLTGSSVRPSDELQLGARGPGELVVHHVLERGPGDVVVTEHVQSGGGGDGGVPVVRVSQAVFEEHEYGQRDEQHGERREIGHGERGVEGGAPAADAAGKKCGPAPAGRDERAVNYIKRRPRDDNIIIIRCRYCYIDAITRSPTRFAGRVVRRGFFRRGRVFFFFLSVSTLFLHTRRARHRY